MPTWIGPYRVLAAMGEGGTGRVYRCVHGVSESLAAVKVPLEGGAHEREALRREIATLRRLAQLQHPGIVRWLDDGIHEGMPWYAMEHIDGSDLGSFRRELWETSARAAAAPEQDEQSTESISISDTRLSSLSSALAAGGEPVADVDPLPSQRPSGHGTSGRGARPLAAAGQLEVVLGLAARVADALDLLHSEGVVHGDVTPRNVIVRPADGHPVLVDFGTSFHPHNVGVEREVAWVTSALRGTPAYIAPERLLGEPLDARCDLYGFGCILYELVTNRRAFEGSTTVELFLQHRTKLPTPPSHHVEGIPAELEALILRLLAKQPTERLGQAREVAVTLRRLLGEERESVPGTVTRGAPLYRPRLAGREQVLEKLWSFAQAAIKRSGGLVLLGGESGIGKTRLLNELGARAAARGMLVVSSHCQDSTHDGARGNLGGRSLGALLPLMEHIADVCGDPSAGELLMEVGQCLAVLKPYASSAFDSLKLPESPPQLSPEAARNRVIRSMTDLLHRYSERNPMLLIIDDLQWADELTLAVLSNSGQRLAARPVLIAATYRHEQAAESVRDLARNALADLLLDRLPPLAIHSLAKDMLGLSYVPEGLGQFLHQQSEGNPFFAAEYLRAALSRGYLRSEPSGQWVFNAQGDLALPSSLGELLALRVAGLSPKAVATLQLVSVLGREIDTRLLEVLPDAVNPADTECLEELVARQILEWVAPGRYRFVHDKLREAQAAALSPEVRRSLHRVAAQRLEDMASADQASQVDEAQLGIHWAHAAEPERALPHLEAAARAAELGYSPARAADLYRLATVECGLLHQRAPERFRARLAALFEALGDALVIQAQHGEARSSYERASALLRSHERLARARIHRKQAASYWTLHDYANAEQSHECAARALGTPKPEHPEEVREHIEIQLGILEQLYFSRRVGAETERAFEQLKPLVDHHATPAQRCHYYVGAASEAFARRRYAFSPEIVSLARSALAQGTQDVPLNEVASVRLMMGFALLAGPPSCCEEAVEWCRASEEDARRAEDSTLLSRILTYQTMALLRLGRVEATRDAARTALSTAEAVQLPPYVAAAIASEAWVEWRTGRTAQAQVLGEKALGMWRAHGHAFPFRWVAIFPMLDIYSKQEDFVRATDLLSDLLDPTLQALPDELTEAIRGAAAACRNGPLREAHERLLRTLRLAQDLHYC